MPYNINRVPNTPMTPSMLPRAITLHDSDIVILVQPINSPGQKCRSSTLSQLAGFIASGGVSSITFTNDNGFVATASEEGFNYHKDATVSDQATRDFAIDEDGVHVSVATSNYTKKFETDGTKAVITKTQSDLVDKVEIFENYIQISHQTRDGANVITTNTSRIAWDHMRTPEVRVMQDENNYIPISWDSTNNEFVIWQRANSGKVAVPKLHVYGTLEVEKDTTIRADVNITKTITVAGIARFIGDFTNIKTLYATDYAETYCRLKTARLNLKNEKSYFTVSSNTNINTLIAGVSEQIAVAEGDIVTLRNNSNTDIEVVMGLRKVTLNAFCAMQFICHGTDGTNTQWAPLGNATVTLA